MAAASLAPEDQDLVDHVTNRWRLAEDQHATWRSKADRFYAMYRNFNEFRNRAGVVDRRDRDQVLGQAKKEWGEELFIPYAFSTVETILPRMLSNRPRMLVLPRDEEALGKVDNMKLIIDAQQEACGYELVLQDVAKDGLIYGLGVQKTGWRKEYRMDTPIVPGQYDQSKWMQGDPQQVCKVDDAWAWRVDPFNFFWDPYAENIDCCEFVIERTWRSRGYVERMVSQGMWRQDFDIQELLRGSGTNKRDDVWSSRLAAEGESSPAQRGDPLHEVWEFHDGDQVITVLDGMWPVQVGPNPGVPGELPYQVFRPTKAPGRIPGIGEIEPIEDLQRETNEWRGMRMDAAKFALNQSYAYDETAVDGDDLANGIFPGSALPVNGDPRQFLFPLPLKDIPQSAMMETDAMRADMDRATGISDDVAGSSGGAAQTATGVQLVQDAAGRRIANKTRRLEAEIIIPGCDQWIAYNQRRILTQRDVPVPGEAVGDVPAWSFVKLGPGELRGRMAASTEGGSTAPENVPQQRSDAQLWMQMMGMGVPVDPQKAAGKILELLGVKHPETFLASQVHQLPADLVGQWMQSSQLPPQAFQSLMDFVQQAQQQQDPNAPQQPPQGPPQGQQAPPAQKG